jgi:hypothetical protein
VFGVLAGFEGEGDGGWTEGGCGWGNRIFSLGNLRFEMPLVACPGDDLEAQDAQDVPLGRAIINAAGEGAIWVCDANGPVGIGGLLVTAALPGLAMSQAHADPNGMPFLNTTVAKATCACDFSHAPVEHTVSGTRFRRALIGCVYA